MAINYVDPENGDDANSGLSLALAKKTINGIGLVWDAADTIYLAPGVYPKSNGTIGSYGANKVWRAIHYGTVTAINDTASSTYHSTSNDTTDVKGVRYKDIAIVFTHSNNSSIKLSDCVFDNCGVVLAKGASWNWYSFISRCAIINCGNGVDELIGGLAGINGSGTNYFFSNNVIAGGNTGTAPLILLNAHLDIDVFANNLFVGNTAKEIYTFQSGDGTSYFVNFHHNSYYNNTLTNFCTTSTGVKASLAAFQADTLGGDNSDELDPGLLDYVKGLVLATPGGNADRTGVGGSHRGIGIGHGISDNIDGVQWNTMVSNPVAECSIDGSGDLVHAGTALQVVTATFDPSDMGALKSIKKINVSDFEDYVYSKVDVTLANTTKTIEVRFGDSEALCLAASYSEYDIGEVQNILTRWWQVRITIRTDAPVPA